MKYFIDTEFLEGTQDKTIFGIKYGKTKPTIDLISIGIVSEDGREYYAISKEFNLKEAWNRYDIKYVNDGRNYSKIYWIRENVLKAIWVDEYKKEFYPNQDVVLTPFITDELFTYNNFKKLINNKGKTNKQIAKEIITFIHAPSILANGQSVLDKNSKSLINILGTTLIPIEEQNNQFYGYYADYDWVVFCWLFGKMNNLPDGFPMYCIDLKQELDKKANVLLKNSQLFSTDKDLRLIDAINYIKENPNYPKQLDEHNALADAKWNYKLYKFLNQL